MTFGLSHRKAPTRNGNQRKQLAPIAARSQDCAPGTTTRLRSLKLIDRFTRHLMNIELRADNRAAQILVNETGQRTSQRPCFFEIDILRFSYPKPYSEATASPTPRDQERGRPRRPHF